MTQACEFDVGQKVAIEGRLGEERGRGMTLGTGIAVAGLALAAVVAIGAWWLARALDRNTRAVERLLLWGSG